MSMRKPRNTNRTGKANAGRVVAAADQVCELPDAKVGSRRVESSAKRVDNPHCGHMIEVWVDEITFLAWNEVLRDSGRCNIDLLKLAVEHRSWFSYLYKARPIKRERRICVRPTLNYRATLTELAWEHKLPRNRWLSNTVTQFLEVVDRPKLTYVLQTAEDITHKVLTDDDYP